MGHVLMSRLRPTARLERALQVLPGSIIVATIAPSLAQGGPAAWIGVLVSVVTMATTRYDLAALIGGVGAVALIRSAGF